MCYSVSGSIRFAAVYRRGSARVERFLVSAEVRVKARLETSCICVFDVLTSEQVASFARSLKELLARKGTTEMRGRGGKGDALSQAVLQQARFGAIEQLESKPQLLSRGATQAEIAVTSYGRSTRASSAQVGSLLLHFLSLTRHHSSQHGLIIRTARGSNLPAGGSKGQGVVQGESRRARLDSVTG